MKDTGLLVTDRVELSPITPLIAAELVHGVGGDGGFRWAEGGPYDGTRDASGALVRAYERGLYQPEWGAWVILRREDGLALGGAGFHGPPTDGVVEIGYDLAPGARGKGYATETARLLVAYAFTHAVVRVVQAHTEPTNLPSQAVLTRAGFVRDGETEGLFRFTRTLP
ncbi:GNAT family N-acetyltransferase [Streptacidiphilus monticola]|uniref:GNAT family N-acetyltransferase n=1 Tax=Streptacidiphilus monticola TaxID=2161674 RepID=A0ABW1G4W6_9ACTN